MKAPFDTAAAKAGQVAWAEYLGVPVIEKNAVGIELALIPPGEFLMGSSDEDVAHALKFDPTIKISLLPEQPQHPVRITQPFQLGVYPVQQGEYQLVMDYNPSHATASSDVKQAITGLDFERLPVEAVTWFDAVVFCNRLSERCGLPEYYSIDQLQLEGKTITGATVAIVGGKGYRLPTEAEWEYSTRAGTTTPYWFGYVLNGSEANIDGNRPFGTAAKGPSLRRPSATGSYPKNPFGCFDQHGNVWEFCADQFDPTFYSKITTITDNPICDKTGSHRVLRGGSWDRLAAAARSAARIPGPINRGNAIIGFRVARTT